MEHATEQERIIWKILHDYHSATQGNSYAEEKEHEAIYRAAITKYGTDAVQTMMDKFNKIVIRGEK